MKRIAVLGSGSWGTAIVKILSNNCPKINWWVREPEIIESLREFGHNAAYLSSVEFNKEKLNVSDNIEEVINNSDVLVFVIPSAFLHRALENLSPDIFDGKQIVSAIKGIVPEHNDIVAEYFETFFNMSYNDFVVVSGPSHAEEIALEKLTYLTVASQNPELAKEVSGLFSCRYVHTSLSDDIFGTEYSAVMKNVIAIANGMCISLGYGDNFQAALIANGLQEIKRFVDAVHPIQRDVSASVYLGDLMVTCYSQFSRNRTFGAMIGKGYSVKFAQFEMKMVAEGYYAVKCLWELNKRYKVDMPITTAVYNVLYEGHSVAEEIQLLSQRIS